MGIWVLIGAVLLTVALGAVRRGRGGRIRAGSVNDSAPSAPSIPAPVRELISTDAAVTLVQVSTTFCAPAGTRGRC